MTVNPAGAGTGAHSSGIGVEPNIPGQSLLSEMPHHELLEWATGPAPAGIKDIIFVLNDISHFA